MLSFYDMEKYNKLLQEIQRYSRFVADYGEALRAQNYNAMPRSSNTQTDRIEQLLIKKETALNKLPGLRAFAASQRPDIERTIREAVSGSGKNRIRDELILRMRYLSGHSWKEISEIIGKMDEKGVYSRAAFCLRGIEEKNES